MNKEKTVSDVNIAYIKQHHAWIESNKAEMESDKCIIKAIKKEIIAREVLLTEEENVLRLAVKSFNDWLKTEGISQTMANRLK